MPPQTRDYWASTPGAPLAFLIPGSTGTKRPIMRGYDAMAAALWMKGFNVQIFISPGQEGSDGKYSLGSSLKAARTCLSELVMTTRPSSVQLIGGCAGGAVAAHLVEDITECPVLLGLWETPLKFADELHREFIKRAGQTGLPVAEDYWTQLVNLSDVAEKITCPVHLGYGDVTRDPLFSRSVLHGVRVAMCNADVEECFIAGANHDLPRGSSSALLDEYLNHLGVFFHKHNHIADSR